MQTKAHENLPVSIDFKIYLDHLKGIWLTRDPQMHDVLYRRHLIDLESEKYEWVLDDEVNVCNKIKNRIAGYQDELNNLELNKIVSIERSSCLFLLSKDSDYLELLQQSLNQLPYQNYSFIFSKIRTLQRNYHEAIKTLNRQNSNHLFKIINGSSFFSESPKEDCEDILQETHLKMLHKIHLPDFSYPITEPTKTSFNALIKIVAERQWYMLIRKRQVKNKHLVFTKAEFDENVATLIDAQLEKEKNINLDTLSQLIKQHREIKILVRIFKIDDEADELKRINEWSEKVKDEYIWGQRKILLKEINYTPNFLGKISDSYFKVKGQEVIRKRKEAGIKKIKKVFTNYIFH